MKHKYYIKKILLKIAYPTRSNWVQASHSFYQQQSMAPRIIPSVLTPEFIKFFGDFASKSLRDL